MSVYNAAPFLHASITSILNQSFDDFEFVIINDGSTDDSADYLNSITDPRVRVTHQENQGLGKPQNEAIRACRGKYIMRMDADDVSHRTRVEKQVSVLESEPETIMVGSFFRFFGTSGSSSTISKLPTTHKAILSGMLNGWHTMAHGTTMFRRSLFDKIEGYLISGAGEDWTLLLDAARFGNYAMIPEALYDVRLHSSSNAWRGAEQVELGFMFARQRHKQFLQHQTDLTHEEFLSSWKEANLFEKTKVRFAAISNLLHRQAVLGRINGQRLVPFIRMIGASLLNPSKTIGAVWKRVKTRSISAA